MVNDHKTVISTLDALQERLNDDSVEDAREHARKLLRKMWQHRQRGADWSTRRTPPARDHCTRPDAEPIRARGSVPAVSVPGERVVELQAADWRTLAVTRQLLDTIDAAAALYIAEAHDCWILTATPE